MNRVFVSYSRRNEAFAERLARDLSDAGLDVWIDLRQIHGGEFWQQEIFRGLQRADFIIVIVSPEALASEWVAREVEFGRQNSKRIFPIMIADVFGQVEDNDRWRWLLDVQFLDFRGQYETAFPRLMQALPGGRRMGVFDEFNPENVPNPFKGLEAFQQRDSAFFFGREELTRKAISRMQRTRFLAVVGASGSGKSSLVRAGFIPQVRAGKLPGSENWPIVIFTPGTNPIEALALRLGPLLPGADDADPTLSLQKRLLDPAEFDAVCRLALHNNPESAQLLLLVDQFEEVFTRSNAKERAAFLNLLQAAATSEQSRAQIIITMRADFFGELSAYPELATLFEQDHLLIVTEMTTANLLRVIQGPVQAVGMRYESGLVDRILEDVSSEPGSLPLLQYALRELFKRRAGDQLTLAAYDDIGGVQQALARHAEAIYTQMSAREQQLTRKVLLRLVEVSPSGEATRRRVRRPEIHFRDVPDDEVQQVLGTLTAQDARLLIASRTPGGRRTAPTVWLEISHEAFIREWDRLRSWVTDSAEDLIYDAELREAAENWRDSGQDVSFLLTGRRLDRAEIWLENADPSDLQRRFIEASLNERNRRERAEAERYQRELELQGKAIRRARFLIVLSVAMLILAGIGVLILTQNNQQLEQTITERNRANAELEQREEEARSLAVAALASDNEGDLALSLAVAAARLEAAPSQTQRTLSEIAFAPGTRQKIDVDSSVVSLAFSPDDAGSLFATGRNDGLITLHASATGEPLRLFDGHTDAVRYLAISPDLQYLLSATNSEVFVWQLDTGTRLDQLPLASSNQSSDGSASTARVTGVAFLANPVRAVVSGDDGWVEVYAARSDGVFVLGSAYAPVEGILQDQSAAPITQLAVNMGENYAQFIVSGTQNGRVRLHDPNNPQSIRWIATPYTGAAAADARAVTALAVDVTGEFVLAGFADGRLALYDAATGSAQADLPNLERGVVELAFVPGSNLFVVIGDDNALRLWDREIERQINRFQVDASLTSLSASPNGNTILTSAADRTLRLWDIRGSAELASFGNQRQINDVGMSHDGERVVSASTDGTLYLWDALTGELRLGVPVAADTWLNAVAVDPTGAYYATGTTGGIVYLINASTLSVERELQMHDSIILDLSFSADGTLLASASADQTAKLWRLPLTATNPAPVQTFSGHEGSVFAVDISPDKQQVLTGSQDDTMRLWSASDGETQRIFSGHSGDIRSVTFSDDMRFAASGATDTTVRIWNLDSQRAVLPLTGHSNNVRHVAFVPGGSALISGSDDGTVRLWDTASGFELRRYSIQNDEGNVVAVRSMATGADGNLAVTGMSDRTMRLWQFIPDREDLLDWTLNNRFVRELDCNERLFYNVDARTDSSALNQLYEIVQANAILRSDPLDSSESLTDVEAGTLVRRLDSMTLTDAASNSDWVQVCTLDGLQGWIDAQRLNTDAS